MAGVVSGGLAPNAALSRHEQNSPGFAVNPRCSHGGDVGLGDAGTMLPKVAGVPEITLHLTAGTARNSYITNPPRHRRSRQSDLPPTTSLRTGRSPHPCALCLVPADVGSVLGRSVPLPTAVVVRPGRQIEPNHDVGRAVLLGFLLGSEVRRGRSRGCSHTREGAQ